MSEEKELTLVLPTLKISVVVGQHHIHSALEMLTVLAFARKDLEKVLAPIQAQLAPAVRQYQTDVHLLENLVRGKEKEAQAYATKVVEAYAALEMEKELTVLRTAEVERLQNQLHQKNVGFAEAMQAKNKECSEMENAKEIAEAKAKPTMEELRRTQEVLRGTEESLQRVSQRVAELSAFVSGLRNWIRKKGLRLPGNLR